MAVLPIVLFITSIIITSTMTFFFTRKMYVKKQNIIIKAAEVKALNIKNKANSYFQNKQIEIKEKEASTQKQYKDKILELEKMQTSIIDDRKTLDSEIEKHKALYERNIILQQETNFIKDKYSKKLHELMDILSSYTSLSIQEAKSILFSHLKNELKIEKADYIRRYEQEAKEEANIRANYILSLATSRYAGEYGAEKLINTIYLPDDEMKGRIIGKDGRNIRALEMITGVDIIIDDTPNVIVLSSFNLYRRTIAFNTINLLIEDGRIQPSRIESIYKKCVSEMEDNVFKEGESAILDLKLGYVHPELIKLIGKLKYRASYGQNMLSHSIEVAYLSGLIAGELSGDITLARRAGLLHDIGKVLTHETNVNHVTAGVEIAKKYSESPTVINAILAHHGNEHIKSVECAAVCAADSISGARPGARKEVLESYLKGCKI